MKLSFINLILFILILVSTCKNNENKKLSKPDKEQSINEDEVFKNFIKKFCSDSIFQKNNVQFPLIKYELGFDEKKTLLKISLKDYAIIPIDIITNNKDYNYILNVNKNFVDATLEVKGVDTGILIIYTFKKIKNKWTLVEINDFST